MLNVEILLFAYDKKIIIEGIAEENLLRSEPQCRSVIVSGRCKENVVENWRGETVEHGKNTDMDRHLVLFSHVTA